MPIAILIHVHTHPLQVQRLVSKLQHPDVDVYINVDAKVDIQAFESIVQRASFLHNRVEVRWGRFSQVQQILNSFDEILKSGKTYSHILFISGLDYPIQPISKIVEFLQKNEAKSFIDFHQLGTDEWSTTIKKRYQYWHFLPESDIRNKPLVKKVLTKLGVKRSYPFKDVYYGSCWFCLTTKSIAYLLDYTKNNPKVVKFFQHSGCADELYIQSVLLHSPFKDTFVNQIYRFFDWSDNGKSPKILTVKDLPKIQASNAWFARKLDLEIDPVLFDKLDEISEKTR